MFAVAMKSYVFEKRPVERRYDIVRKRQTSRSLASQVSEVVEFLLVKLNIEARIFFGCYEKSRLGKIDPLVFL